MRLITVLVLLVVIAALAGAVIVLGQAGNDAGKKQDPAELARTMTIKKGAELYAKYCAFCHGKQGEGFVADEANALGNQEFLKSATDDFIIQGIKRGRPGTPMSAWGKKYGGVLEDSDVQALLAFIRAWQVEESVEISDKPIKGDSKAGAKTYEAMCAKCHGDKGQGGTAVSINNPFFHETASDGYIRYAVSEGRPGTPMRSFKRQLLAGEIDDLVAYVRTLKTDVKAGPVEQDVDATFSKGRIENAVLNPEGMPAEFHPHMDRYVPADTVYAALAAGESFVILDARPYNDYLKAHVRGAISVPFYDVDKAAAQLPRDRWIIAYCVCPHAMSGKALDRLRELGFEKTAILDEGFYEWALRGYPVVRQ